MMLDKKDKEMTESIIRLDSINNRGFSHPPQEGQRKTKGCICESVQNQKAL
jgi:hypothetical protein